MRRGIKTILGVVWCIARVGWVSGCSHPETQPPASRGASAATGCPGAPPYQVGRTRFGVSLGRSSHSLSFAEAVRSKRQTFGRLGAVRVFDPGIPPWNAWPRRASTLGPGTAVVISFRADPRAVLSGRYDARLRHFFRTAPRHRDVFWSFNHEPESEIEAGDYTASAYREAFRHIVDLAARLCRKNLYPTLILTGWTAEPESGRDWRTYYPGARYISVLGWDPYNSTQVPTSYEAPWTLFRPEVLASQAAHKPWAIAETGSPLVPGDPGSGRAHWLREVGGYAVRHHAAFVTYFDASTDSDYRLLDGPSIRAWSDQIGR